MHEKKYASLTSRIAAVAGCESSYSISSMTSTHAAAYLLPCQRHQESRNKRVESILQADSGRLIPHTDHPSCDIGCLLVTPQSPREKSQQHSQPLCHPDSHIQQ